MEMQAELEKYSPENINALAKYLDVENDIDKVANRLSWILNFPDKKCATFTNFKLKRPIAKVRQILCAKYTQFTNRVDQMTTQDIMQVLRDYDKLCFDNYIFQHLLLHKNTIKIQLEGEKLFTTEAYCRKSCAFVITIPLFYFRRVKSQGATLVAGQPCYTQFECLLRVLEHEMTHLIIFMLCRDQDLSNYHGKLFMDTIYKLWGHTLETHNII
jgi:hypothetical protein